jgi:hypothetical protein
MARASINRVSSRNDANASCPIGCEVLLAAGAAYTPRKKRATRQLEDQI